MSKVMRPKTLNLTDKQLAYIRNMAAKATLESGTRINSSDVIRVAIETLASLQESTVVAKCTEYKGQ